ncbi:MAG: hypothetical protein QOF77_737 [Solirubrobacteraceae bacterium]|nr:hypothetical protein [Solirubrobacteraceae bacterium]
MILGDGARLFEYLTVFTGELEGTRAVAAPGVTHLSYRAA